jgi:hypothetical protein
MRSCNELSSAVQLQWDGTASKLRPSLANAAVDVPAQHDATANAPAIHESNAAKLYTLTDSKANAAANAATDVATNASSVVVTNANATPAADAPASPASSPTTEKWFARLLNEFLLKSFYYQHSQHVIHNQFVSE